MYLATLRFLDTEKANFRAKTIHMKSRAIDKHMREEQNLPCEVLEIPYQGNLT